VTFGSLGMAKSPGRIPIGK